MAKNKFTALLTRKNIIYTAIALAVVIGGYFLFFNKKTEQQTLTVRPGQFLQQVSASGTIVAKQDLDLSFEEGGTVKNVYANVGDKVYAGQLLASQSTGQLGAQLLGMQAGIDLEQARLDQLLAGNSPEDIQTAQDTVETAEQNLQNSYMASQNNLSAAYNTISASYNTVRAIGDTYFNQADAEGIKAQASIATIKSNATDAANYSSKAQASSDNNDKDTAIAQIISNLNSTYNNLSLIRQLCEGGTYYSRVTATDKASLETQKTNINAILTTVTSAQSTIASYKTSLKQAQDSLALKKAPARTSDIAVYQAQIAQAKANAQNVIAQLNKKRIYSPISGVITAVNAKVGSLSSPSNIAISIISTGNFQVESYIPEINIALLKVSNPATVTLDAYGDNTFFNASIISIDPAETVKNGVSTYKVVLGFTDANDDRIKSGMTGNVVITTEKKDNVVAVPQGIVTFDNGKSFVSIKEGQTITKREISTGDVSSSGNVEVVSGLRDGDIVILTK